MTGEVHQYPGVPLTDFAQICEDLHKRGVAVIQFQVQTASAGIGLQNLSDGGHPLVRVVGGQG